MSCPKYPNDSEHEYILWIIQSDYLFSREDEWNAEKNLLYDNAIAEQVNRSDQIQELRWRREEILQRLYLDTQLRQKGTTYAEVIKRQDKLTLLRESQ